MFEAADAARVRAARRPGAKPYAGAFAGEWTLRNPRNAREPGSETVPRETLRWSDWANALNGQRLVSWVREEVFPFHAGIAAEGVTDFMADARLVIDEPTVLSQVVSHVNDLHLEQVDADTKGDLFEHVLGQIRQAGELGQFRTPRHVIRALVQLVDPRLGETVHDPAAGTAGFLVGAYDHIRLANSSDAGIEEIEADGKTVRRGLGDTLSRAAVRQLHEATFFGNDVDPRMVRLATMNLTLRGLDRVRILRRDALTRSLDRTAKAELGLPVQGFDVVLANPPFSGRLDPDRIVEDVKVGRTRQTELLFLQYLLNHLKDGGRCGVVVPEGVLFGSTGAHRELRRKLVENNRVEAVLSLPGGVFNPYSGVKTSVLVFRKGGATGRVMFLHADNDGFKLDANHDTPIDDDDLPGLGLRVPRPRGAMGRLERARSRDGLVRELVVRRCGHDPRRRLQPERRAVSAAEPDDSGPSRPAGDPRRMKAIENEILGEIDDLAAAVREAVDGDDPAELVPLGEAMRRWIAGGTPRPRRSRRGAASDCWASRRRPQYRRPESRQPGNYPASAMGRARRFASTRVTCSTPSSDPVLEQGRPHRSSPVQVLDRIGPVAPAARRRSRFSGVYLLRRRETVAFVMSSVTGHGCPVQDMKSTLMSMPVPLPPLDEQRRIVDILNRTARIETLRARSAERLREFVPALFVKMFGDPVENPMGWRTEPLGGVILNGPQNGLYRPKSAYGSGTPILRIDGFYEGRVTDPARWQRVRLDRATVKKFALRKDDIVINRVNSRPFLGKSAIIPDIEEPTVFESNMMRIGLDPSQILPKFLISMLQIGSIKNQLCVNAKEAINQSSINQPDVLQLLVVAPPLALQRRYAEIVEVARAVARVRESSARTAAALMASLVFKLLGERWISGTHRA